MRSILVLVAALALVFTAVSAQDCTSCTTLVGMIEELYLNGYTENETLSIVESFCTNIPGFTQICDQIAVEGLDEIFAYIKQNEDPTQVCTELGFCSKKRMLLPIPTKPMIPASTECTECGQVIAMIENWMANSLNEKQIITAVEAFCTYVPGFETTCDQIIETGVPTVISYIIEYENASVVCGQIGMCGAEFKAAIVAAKPKSKSPLDDCSVCQEIIYFIENYAESSSSISSIETYLEIACAIVPSWKSQCDTVITTGVPQIVQWLEANEDSQQVCTQLEQCSSISLGKVALN